MILERNKKKHLMNSHYQVIVVHYPIYRHDHQIGEFKRVKKVQQWMKLEKWMKMKFKMK
jgi:hypothetical protein